MNKKVLILGEAIREKRKITDICQEYTHIRGYHGCRPLSIDEYYTHGIKPIEKSFAREEAITRLCSRWITKEKVMTVFEEEWEKLRYPDVSVFLTYSKTELLEECGHYIIYGSEFICGMAAKLLCQPNLKKIGIPTVFYCDISLNSVPQCYLDEISEKIHNKDSGDCFRVEGKVLPVEIVNCIHPNKIHDPLTGTTYIHTG